MEQYRCNGLDISKDDNSVRIKVRDGKIVFSTKHGETCYFFGVKFLIRYDKIYHNEPRKCSILINYSWC